MYQVLYYVCILVNTIILLSLLGRYFLYFSAIYVNHSHTYFSGSHIHPSPHQDLHSVPFSVGSFKSRNNVLHLPLKWQRNLPALMDRDKIPGKTQTQTISLISQMRISKSQLIELKKTRKKLSNKGKKI